MLMAAFSIAQVVTTAAPRKRALWRALTSPKLTYGGKLRPRPLDLVGRFERRRDEFAGLLTG
jgi:hypothetical protein